MAKSHCKNADDVLPPELVAEIRKHYVGLLWIPTASTFYQERNQLIRQLRASGESVRDIARLVHLTEERIRQIVKNDTQK